jgi:hypothetical protein
MRLSKSGSLFALSGIRGQWVGLWSLGTGGSLGEGGQGVGSVWVGGWRGRSEERE